MMQSAFLRFHDLAGASKAAITASLAIVAFVIGALLEDGVQRLGGGQAGDAAWGLLWIVFSLVLAGAWGAVQYAYQRALEKRASDLEAQGRTIADARERLAKLSVEQLARCDSFIEEAYVAVESFRSVLICDGARVSSLIVAAWEVVNSHHNVSVGATERINFELTLITPSMRDRRLTIAAWCNRENRRPKSLLLREAGDTEIYSKTEAAKMIHGRVTDTIVIPDTSSPSANYEQLYEGQRARIRSTVLHPILTPKSEHLGVLVLHCEQAGFFKSSDQRYWHELFAVFAPAIALELERIRAFNSSLPNWPPVPAGPYQPF